MGTFNVTYPNGRETVEEQSDCETIDDFINTRFGSAINDSVIVTLAGTKEPEKKPEKEPEKKLVKVKK